MKKLEQEDILKKLQLIPGIGPKLSRELLAIGIKDVPELVGRDPEELYLDICARNGRKVDRCVLYVCRSVVYFAETKRPDPEKLKWWNWKD